MRLQTLYEQTSHFMQGTALVYWSISVSVLGRGEGIGTIPIGYQGMNRVH